MPFVLNSKSASGLLNLNVASGVADSLLTGLLAFYPLHSNLLDASNFGSNSNYLGGDPNSPVDNNGNSPYFDVLPNTNQNGLMLNFFSQLLGAFSAQSSIIDQTQSYTLTCWTGLFSGNGSYGNTPNDNTYPPFIGTSLLIGSGSSDAGLHIGTVSASGQQKYIYSNNGAYGSYNTYGATQAIQGTNDLLGAFSEGAIFIATTYNASTNLVRMVCYSSYGANSPYISTRTITAPSNNGYAFVIGNDGLIYTSNNIFGVNRSGLWQRVLTDAEILRLWNSGSGIELDPNTNTWG